MFYNRCFSPYKTGWCLYKCVTHVHTYRIQLICKFDVLIYKYMLHTKSQMKIQNNNTVNKIKHYTFWYIYILEYI